MVAPIPVSKAAEIRDFLSSFIDDKKVMSEFDIKRFEREISKLPHQFEKDELKAFLLGAQGKNDEAINQFERAIQLHAEYSTVCNFCIFLKRIQRLFEAKHAYCSYYQWFDDYQMLSSAIAFLGFSGDADGLNLCTQKLIGILGRESDEAQKMTKIHDDFIGIYDLAQQQTGISNADINDLTDIAFKVIDSNQTKHKNGQFLFADSTLAFVVSVHNPSAEELTDLNINASFALADHETLYGKNVSIVFREIMDN